jgi:benzodiazapine receptor
VNVFYSGFGESVWLVVWVKVGRVWKIVLGIVLCELAGVVGSVFTFPSIGTWYASLEKPGFNPPNWLFAPVWIVLYALMGVSLGLVWNKGVGDRRARVGMMVFGVQLVLNVLWSVVFFGAESLIYGWGIIVVLWFAIAFTIVLFYRVNKVAGLLLVPYICWVTVATILNYYLWILNT